MRSIHLPCVYRNELERVYLDHITYNVNVPASVYAKYYFDLRTLSEENGLVFPNEYVPLSKEKATEIEVSKHKDCELVSWTMFC